VTNQNEKNFSICASPPNSHLPHLYIFQKQISTFIGCSNELAFIYMRKKASSRLQWLTPKILAIGEAEIGRILVQDQSRQILHEIPSPKCNQIEMDWRCGASGSAPALQTQKL
jgi:hypothetical protein